MNNHADTLKKPISIRLKITLWYTTALIAMALFTGFAIFFAGNQILQKTIRDNLIETVEHNVDEIEFFGAWEELEQTKDVDQFVRYGSGYLEIDDDFLDQVNEVYTALYREDITLLYGENPISKETAGLPLQDSLIQRTTVAGTVYYIFDRELTGEGLEGLWLRGVVSEQQGVSQMSDMLQFSLVFLPALVLLAVGGGYLIARRMLRPIQQLSETAEQIQKGGDLKKRIELDPGKDELHQLADRFNAMFARLDEAFASERQFVSDASHELRTPTSVILAQCEFSLEEPRSGQEYEKALCTIQRQGRKMSRLIRDMLDVTRLETRADSYVREPLDLEELVDSLCEDMALIREKGITLEWQTQKASCLGNRSLLTRLLSNLISNAYRYGRENGHIRVCLRRREDRVELTVEDDGIGISAEDQDKIFRRFYQADPSRAGTGTGLGLSMAAEIAQIHGGRLFVESELGKGSKFTFSMEALDGAVFP